MIRKWTEHSMYLHHLELEISSLSIPEKNRLFRMHHDSLLKLTLLNLDNLFPVIKPLYPVFGRPAKNQCELLRSLILMIDFKKHDTTVLFRYTHMQELTEALFPLDAEVPGQINTWPFLKWNWRKEGEVPSSPKLRCIAHELNIYRRDDLTGPLPLGEVQSLALLSQSYKLALTPEMIPVIYGDLINDSMIRDEGKYVEIEGRKGWWIPSAEAYFSDDGRNSPADIELQYARDHFFMVHSTYDPFGNMSSINYDKYHLLPVKTTNPVGDITKAQYDYRVMKPKLVTDPNGNRTEVAFDILGRVAGTAVMGKENEKLGDSLSHFKTDLDRNETDMFFANPEGPSAAALLGNASVRFVYDADSFCNLRDPGKPIRVAMLSRETHASDMPGEGGLKIQVALSYSDGFGREIQKKLQAESGNVNGVWTQSRWIGSGWIILNNKGKPVKQFEPFFSSTHHFEYAIINGVSPTLFYDPLERVIARLHPNHTYEKTVFDPWEQSVWDVNDTIVSNPLGDADVNGFFEKLQQDEFLPTWYEQRINGDQGIAEKQAAEKSALHANTPSVTCLDSLGRKFLTIADNGSFGKYATRIEFDAEGRQRAVIDAMGRAVLRVDYDIPGSIIHQSGMEAGEHRVLNDAAGKVLRGWNSRGIEKRITYDGLRRQKDVYITENGIEQCVETYEYGDSFQQAENFNLRGKVVTQADEAGIADYLAYDFKGNLLTTSRRIARDHIRRADWPVLPGSTVYETYTATTTYDALNRPVRITTPEGSVFLPVYNKANLLEKVEVNLQGAAKATLFVKNIEYNAKGQRTRIEYGSGAGPDRVGLTTVYEYDKSTFRLMRIRTTRPAGSNSPAPSMFNNAEVVQDLHYTYDPAGNITRITDNAFKDVFYGNQKISPLWDYTYDAVCRLIEAKGREHTGQNAFSMNTAKGCYRDYPFAGMNASPFDPQAMRNYTQQYLYDAAGNIEKLIHNAANGSWTRSYNYNEQSQTEASMKNNRLTSCTVGNSVEAFEYDVHGNMISMPHLHNMQWNYYIFIVRLCSSVIGSFIGIILNKLILDHFGSDLNGLVATISQMMSALYLLEGGFSLAATVKLYTPYLENDYARGNHIQTVLGLEAI